MVTWTELNTRTHKCWRPRIIYKCCKDQTLVPSLLTPRRRSEEFGNPSNYFLLNQSSPSLWKKKENQLFLSILITIIKALQVTLFFFDLFAVLYCLIICQRLMLYLFFPDVYVCRSVWKLFFWGKYLWVWWIFVFGGLIWRWRRVLYVFGSGFVLIVSIRLDDLEIDLVCWFFVLIQVVYVIDWACYKRFVLIWAYILYQMEHETHVFFLWFFFITVLSETNLGVK